MDVNAYMLLMVLVCAQWAAGQCALDFGPFFEFNAAVRYDFTGIRGDVEGKLAVGGTAWLDTYSIGLRFAYDKCIDDKVLVANRVTWNNGNLNAGQISSNLINTLSQVVSNTVFWRDGAFRAEGVSCAVGGQAALPINVEANWAQYIVAPSKNLNDMASTGSCTKSNGYMNCAFSNKPLEIVTFTDANTFDGVGLGTFTNVRSGTISHISRTYVRCRDCVQHSRIVPLLTLPQSRFSRGLQHLVQFLRSVSSPD
jgi:choice-of-anchor A domain-containing protein